MKPKNIKQLQSQSKKLRVWMVNRHTYAVESKTKNSALHLVTVRFERGGVVHARCTCPWAQHSGVACSHVMAALDYLANQKGRTLSFWQSEEDAQRQKHRVFRLGGDENGGVWITSRSSA